MLNVATEVITRTMKESTRYESDFSRLSRLRMPSNLRYIVMWFITDIAILSSSYFVSMSLRLLEAPNEYIDQFAFIGFAISITIIMMYLANVYHTIWANTSGHGVISIIRAFQGTLIILLCLNAILPVNPLPTSVVIVSNFFGMVAIVAVRYRSRLVKGLHWRWRVIWLGDLPQQTTSRVLIVGAGEAGQLLAMRLQYHNTTDIDYQVVGFIDDNLNKQRMLVEGIRILGNTNSIPFWTEQLAVDLIVLAIHNISGSDFRQILTYCQQTLAQIKVIPSIFSMISPTESIAPLRDIEPEDLIGRRTLPNIEAIDTTIINQKVVLITGAAGTIGSEIVWQVARDNSPAKLILLDNNESGLYELHLDLKHSYPEIELVPILGDITQPHHLTKIFDNYPIQVVFHAAAYKHVPMLEEFPGESIRVNILGTLHLLQHAAQAYVERFVLISTDKAVYPNSIMGASKRIGELLIHAFAKNPEYRTLFTAVRFGNVLGSRGSVVPIFERQIKQGGPVTVTHPDMTRFFMSISEAATLVRHAACLTNNDEVFLLRMGDEVRILDIAERMIRLRGMRPYVDIEIEFVGIRPGEKLYEKLYNDHEEISQTPHPFIYQLQERFSPSLQESLLEDVENLHLCSDNSNIDIREALNQIIAKVEPHGQHKTSLHEPKA